MKPSAEGPTIESPIASSNGFNGRLGLSLSKPHSVPFSVMYILQQRFIYVTAAKAASDLKKPMETINSHLDGLRHPIKPIQTPKIL